MRAAVLLAFKICKNDKKDAKEYICILFALYLWLTQPTPRREVSMLICHDNNVPGWGCHGVS